MRADRFEAWSRRCLLAVVLISPLFIYAASQIQIGAASVEQWLPSDRPERQLYDRFTRLFGHDQFLLVSWDDCKVGDPRLPALTEALRSHFEKHHPQLLAQIISSEEMLRGLVDSRADVSEAEAASRLHGFSLGADGTCVIMLTLTEQGVGQRETIVARISEQASTVEGLEAGDLRFAGAPYQTLAIDEASALALQRFLAPSMIACLTVAWFCLKSWRATVNVFLLAGLGQLLSVAMIQMTGGQLSAVLIVLPTLIFMLTLSGAVHLTAYYRDCGGTEAPHAAARAVALGLQPCSLATITTVMGFGSLMISQLEPVRQFGLYSGAALTIATVVLLGLFPGLFTLATKRNAASGPHEDHESIDLHDVTDEPDLKQVRRRRRWPLALAQWIRRYANWVATVGVLGLVISCVGLFLLDSSTRFEHMFEPSSRPVQNLIWFEEHVGPISSIEVLLEFPKDHPSSIVQRIQVLDQLHQTLQESKYVGGVLSPMTFLPPIPQGRSLRDTAKRTAMRRMLTDHRDELIGFGILADDADHELWRITAKVSERQQVNYDRLIQEVQRLCDPIVNQFNEQQPVAAQVYYTGLTAVISEAHRLLLSDLSSSFVCAFWLITPVMMIISRSILTGLLLMIPNVLPVTLVFGVMGLLNIKVDVASILTASVALGIAVDDTLHFMNWYFKARRAGRTSLGAVRHALHECAPAMTHTTLISCSAMLPFFFSDFSPTSKFALLMILILFFAILGDLVLLPALLLSPLGKVVRVKQQHPTEG